jgi:hypothetical protein
MRCRLSKIAQSSAAASPHLQPMDFFFITEQATVRKVLNS